MANEKSNPTENSAPTPDSIFDPTLEPEPAPEPASAFKADEFLAVKPSQAAHIDPPKPTAKAAAPQIVKRGGIGFFTALLMSSAAAAGGAYLALFVGSRPDLVQKAGLTAFVPAPKQAASLGITPRNLEPLLARVSAVEAELLALKTRLGGGASRQAPAEPLTNSITATTAPVVAAPPIVPALDAGAVKGELAGMSGRLTAIETRLAALDPTGAGGAIVAGLQADIAGLKAIVATLQQQAAAAPSPAVTFAVVNLAEAANRPGPFMIELDSVRAAMPNVPEVLALEPYARTGVPTRELLQERFAGLASAVSTAQTPATKDTSILAWFKGLFSNMVTVQSAPDANGTGNVAILGRAKTKLDQGDFAGSLDEVATISAPPASVTEWVSAGRKRLELESRISAVRGAVGRAPATTAPLIAQVPAPAPTPPPAPRALAAPPVPVVVTQGPKP